MTRGSLLFITENSSSLGIVKKLKPGQVSVGVIKHSDNKVRFNGLSIEEMEAILVKMKEYDKIRLSRIKNEVKHEKSKK